MRYANWFAAALGVTVACSSADRFTSNAAGAGGTAGASASGAGGAGAGAAGVGGTSGAPGADAGDDAALDAMADVAPDVVTIDAEDDCGVQTFFLDGDKDGYGGTTTSIGCTPPASGTWVAVGGDCDDSNANAYPGQKNYFPVGYTKTGTSEVSFDYDCDGKETEAGSNPRLGCHVANLQCVGSGYIAADPMRSGAGVDGFCGSSQRVDCSGNTLSCKAGTPYTAAAIACH